MPRSKLPFRRLLPMAPARCLSTPAPSLSRARTSSLHLPPVMRCRRCIFDAKWSRPAASSATARTALTAIARWASTPAVSLEARSQPTCRSCSRRNLNWSSTARPPARSGSTSRRACSPSLMKSSNDRLGDRLAVAGLKVKSAPIVVLCGECRSAGWRGYVFVQPFDDHLRDGVAVLLHHHHVAVAAQANLGERQVIDLDIRLIEIRHGAVVVGCVERGLSGKIEDRPLAHGNQPARRLLLPPATHQIRRLGFVLADEF